MSARAQCLATVDKETQMTNGWHKAGGKKKAAKKSAKKKAGKKKAAKKK
jgi:hypothetical protein